MVGLVTIFFTICKKYGNVNNQLFYNVNKNNIWEAFPIDIHLPAFDTTTYDINY